nr:hypothetical protein [Tanacetum cinerariifolium]
DTEVQEVVEVVNAAKLITEVVTAVATTAASIPILAVEPAVVAISAAKPTVSRWHSLREKRMIKFIQFSKLGLMLT